MKLPKSYIKKYGGINKSAWAAFRKDRGVTKGRKKTSGKKKRAASSEVIHHHHHKNTGTPSRKSGGSKMEKAKKKVKHVAKRARAAMDTRPGKVILMAAEGAAGAVASSLLVNKTPGITALQPIAKAGIQGVLGLGAVIFIKNRHVKAAGAGAVLAAILTAVKATMKIDVLAGPTSRVLTSEELRRLAGGMNMPLPGQMNLPLGTQPVGAGFKGGFGG